MTLTREQVQAYLELSLHVTDGEWTWDGAKEYPDENEGYIPQGSYLGETLITMGDTYENSWIDGQFISQSRTIAPQLAEALLQAWDEVEVLRDNMRQALGNMSMCPECEQLLPKHADDCALRQALEVRE